MVCRRERSALGGSQNQVSEPVELQEKSKAGQRQSGSEQNISRGRPLGSLNRLLPPLGRSILQPELGTHAVPKTLAFLLLEVREADTSRSYVNSCPKSSAEHPVNSRAPSRTLDEGKKHSFFNASVHSYRRDSIVHN